MAEAEHSASVTAKFGGVKRQQQRTVHVRPGGVGARLTQLGIEPIHPPQEFEFFKARHLEPMDLAEHLVSTVPKLVQDKLIRSVTILRRNAFRIADVFWIGLDQVVALIGSQTLPPRGVV